MGHNRVFCVALLSSFPVSSDNHAPQERRRWTQVSQLLSELSSFSYLGWNIYYAKGSTLHKGSNNPPSRPLKCLEEWLLLSLCVCAAYVCGICVYGTCVCVHIFMMLHVHICVYEWGNPRSVSSLFLRKCSACVFESSLPFITNSYIYHGYHGFIYLVRSESQGSTCFPYLSPEITRTRLCSQLFFFMLVWMMEPRSLRFHSEPSADWTLIPGRHSIVYS